MRCTVINASPRGGRGNTARLLEHFVAGMAEGGMPVDRVALAADIADRAAMDSLLAESDWLMLAFPLYVYNLPAQALRLVELLEGREGALAGKTLAFFCQYGFNEACHARDCEYLLQRLCADLGARYGGTLIRGGSEGLDRRPPDALRALYGRFAAMGRHLAEGGGAFDPERLRAFAAPEDSRSSFGGRLYHRAFAVVANWFFWRPQLKKHGALRRERDRPLLDLD